MSKSYSHRRKYGAGADGRAIVLIFVTILAYGLWNDKALMEEVKTYSKYAVALTVLVVVLKAAMSAVKRFKLNRRYFNLKTIDRMTGVEFEHCVARLLTKQGFTHITLTERYDYGVDIVAEKGGIRWGVQVKRHNGLVKAIAVRQVVTALRKYGCDKAMVVSNSHFSRVASELARSNDCVLVDRAQLADWVIEA